MKWDLKSDRPIYIQLVEQIKMRIISGAYKPGDKLPSVRDFAQEAEVNPNTMQKALTELEQKGLVYTQRTSGRFITEDEEMIKRIKNELAVEQTTDFLKRMKELGFDKEEILTLMRDVIKELK
ncbi:GntR family transcriptional regulator [Clostridium polynesiense]|uniref:GntR family transcriptional regulator n=1 Tax=Clostridium polynesiense TaxID=1325933 RepID=UPI00058BE285|nr:GntR family transcriptional regulator [Clostridium polynesiense]